MKSRWVVSCPDLQATGDMMRVHGVPELVARILVSRGVSVDRAASFLNPSLRTDFPDPFALKGMAELADDMAGWIEEGRTIAIFGDFDVDGATSSAVLCRFLRHFGLNPEIYIPDRLSEGYGPNAEALAKLKGGGAEIVVLCDCGATAFDVVETAKAMELCLVILDHHETEDRLPPADHLIDPKRHDDESGFDALAAVGVTFLTCVAVNNRLRARGFFEAKGMDEPPLRDWLDIVALGTVCDMVPLTGPNRLFVRAGLARMATTANAGIRALASAARLSGEITPYHCGFALGPRINAGSRVHRSDLGARLLCTDDPEEARNLAFTLEDCNDKRREIQSATPRA
ncbi:MAG: hypothetical protein EOM26_06880 [Alphaproteobacteria bacterium]|nr:hypothetical protein [Alphaproteobacteria bacterium]